MIRITTAIIVVIGLAALLNGATGTAFSGAAPAHAQTPEPRESGAQVVRRRQVEQVAKETDSTGRYWTPFELARDGRCTEAIDDLTRMANRGRGYEKAQHILGLCLLETGDRTSGLDWINRAANAGLADAQATHLRLYAEEGTAYLPHADAAMWLYLYENNALRLRIGSGHALDPDLASAIRARVPRADYLSGIDRARNWTPVFWHTSAHAP
ncbi:hypothetical protein [Pyruvatibacter sp.]|uniref:hypothetical protein n=1 Tax=Pyruvatibacter sp. TaxID=1981328 RepID=UPI0032ED77AD